MIRWSTVLKEFAKTLDLDPREVIADPEEAMLYAKIIGAMNVDPTAAEQLPGMDTGSTGNGGSTIGTGDIPMPGQEEFAQNDVSQTGGEQGASI